MTAKKMKGLTLGAIGAALLLGAADGTVLAQEPAMAPTQPLLPRAPDGTWTVTYKYKDQGKAPAPGGKAAPAPDRIATIRVEKKKMVYHVTTTKTSGAQSENWAVGDMQICKPEGSKSFVRLTPGNPLYMDFAASDFDALTWIGLDNFKGAEMAPGNIKVFVFEARNVDRRPTAEEAATAGNIAVMLEHPPAGGSKVDEKSAIAAFRQAEFGVTSSRAQLDAMSQLPVEYDNGVFVRAYTFSSQMPPNAPIDIIQLLQVMRDQRSRMVVRASPP